MNLKTGHLLAGGRYRVERVLGQGGFGITYEARDTKFKSRLKSVAIKEFFVKDFCNREEDTNRIIVATQSKVELVEKLRKKFIDEANALFELEHPGIVRVTDTFEENGTAYYVMEYINGSSLSTIIETEGPLNENKALGYICQAASALEYLHGQNRLHLDIKPQNIMVDNDGRVVLIDFGVSKQYDEVNGENTSTLLGSTPGYAPIEQSGSGVSEFYPSTDIYSLGATLYKLLTGTTPLPAHQLASGETLPPLPNRISAATRKAIESAMSLNRNNRPQSIGEFLALLDKNVKAENGKVKVAGKREQSTSSLDALPSDSGLREAKTEPMVATNQSGKPDDGATLVGGSVMNNEIFRSTQNDKEQKPVISTERSDGEISSTDDGETVFNVVIPNVHEESPKKRPFNKRLLTIISVAAICIIAVFFGIKSCNDFMSVEAEAQQATTIAEQQRLEQERLAKEAAEKAEQERIAAERKAKEEAERLAAEKKRKEEDERKRREASNNNISTRSYTVNGVSFKMIAVEGGTFKMGATAEQQNPYDSEKPVHDVTLSNYCIGETEVTQALWQAVMGSNPSRFTGSNNPVECVSYNDCITFINKLNTLLSGQLPSGRKFRLPTEAEWEYAARGGNRSRGYRYSGSDNLGSVAWYEGYSEDKTHQVKQKQANELGLYDMSGNVREWCNDWYGSYSSSSQTNPKGPSSGSFRVLRGGGWASGAQDCRVAGRYYGTPDAYGSHGLRLAL